MDVGGPQEELFVGTSGVSNVKDILLLICFKWTRNSCFSSQSQGNESGFYCFVGLVCCLQQDKVVWWTVAVVHLIFRVSFLSDHGQT